MLYKNTKDRYLKLVDKFTHLGNSISYEDINPRLAKAWKAIYRL